MGVTFYPAASAGIKAESEKLYDRPLYQTTSTARLSFERSFSYVHGRQAPPDLMASSFSLDGPFDPCLSLVPNGFVHAALEAYSRHRRLVIRPDDVWITILTQFNFFVNANAEALRKAFVAHEGKKELQIDGSCADVESMSHQFTELLQENITDPSVREWIIPDFTTTTALDKTVGAIVMMSTFQRYFDYSGSGLGCGLPAVTLAGEKSDWQSLLRRIEKLKEYGLHTTAWYHLLRPVLKRFVAAFDDPHSQENSDFWNRIATQENLMSGVTLLSGWITAFCVFSRKGNWIGPTFVDEKSRPVDEDYASLDAKEFANVYLVPEDTTDWSYERLGPCLVLNDTRFTRISSGAVPPAVVGVDVKVVDDLNEHMAGMIAGLSSYRVTSSGDKEHGTGELDTLQPVLGWWLYHKPEDGQ